MHTTPDCGTFPLADVSGFKQKMLNWLKPFSIFCYLDNRQYALAPQQAECLVAAGVHASISGNTINEADDFIKQGGWIFGHLSYELQTPLRHSSPAKDDGIGFPLFYFFSPQIVLEIKGHQLTVYATEPHKVFDEINRQEPEPDNGLPQVAPKPLLTRQQYIDTIQALQRHILRGDCYEINFCQAFVAEETVINPFAVFQKLMAVSPNPFSALYRLNDKFLLCASPERFLMKKGNRVVSQPIKGTIKRAFTVAEDEGLKAELRNSQKEQSENVMVADLVRNDLTRICKEASVKVEELFGIYTFPQVHQMITTITGELKDDVAFSQIIEATFPMGSMTGAPKHRVMQLIDEYEPVARGIFSGSVGYIRPDGDFDFNVVIRSIMYNQGKEQVSYQVGSGITFYSDAEKEWEECMLKAEAIRQVLGHG